MSYKEVHAPVPVIIKYWLYRKSHRNRQQTNLQLPRGVGEGGLDELEDWDSQFLKIITVFIVIIK